MLDDKSILDHKIGSKVGFTVSDYCAKSDELIGNIKERVGVLSGFVHSVTKNHKKYQPETMELLYREINKMHEQLSSGIINYEMELREDAASESDKKQYRECRHKILKIMDEISLESNLKYRIRQYQMDAGDLFDEIVSLRRDEKKRLRPMGGQHHKRPQTSDKIRQYDKSLKELTGRQIGIIMLLDEIKINNDGKKAVSTDDKSTKLSKPVSYTHLTLPTTPYV